MDVNFDNLVEDAEKHGADYHDEFTSSGTGWFSMPVTSLKALILEYIEHDRKQGQEPVAIVFDDKAVLQTHLPQHTKLFTHAQPTPAQIDEAILEARICELEQSRDDWKARHDMLDAAGFKVARERDAAIEKLTTLTAQNAKLMEALNKINAYAEPTSFEGQISRAALTPQTDNEGKSVNQPEEKT